MKLISFQEIREFIEEGGYVRISELVQEEFAPCASLWGSSTGMVARVESLRGRMSEAGRQVDGLFESVLSESFE